MNLIDEYVVLKGEIDKAKEELETLADKIKSQGVGEQTLRITIKP